MHNNTTVLRVICFNCLTNKQTNRQSNKQQQQQTLHGWSSAMPKKQTATANPAIYALTAIALIVICYTCLKNFNLKLNEANSARAESTHKGVNLRSKSVTQVQQQRPDSPTVTLTWHACKYKVHKLHHRCIILWWSLCTLYLDAYQVKGERYNR